MIRAYKMIKDPESTIFRNKDCGEPNLMIGFAQICMMRWVTRSTDASMAFTGAGFNPSNKRAGDNLSGSFKAFFVALPKRRQSEISLSVKPEGGMKGRICLFPVISQYGVDNIDDQCSVGVTVAWSTRRSPAPRQARPVSQMPNTTYPG
jgi:hypothetical protein